VNILENSLIQLFHLLARIIKTMQEEQIILSVLKIFLN